MNQLCGTSSIVGCQFTLSPMSERYVDIILFALKEVNMSKVWSETDDVSTCIRGKQIHVFDVVKAIFLHAAKTGEHIAMSGTFSIGCPGDSAADVYMDESDIALNKDDTKEIDQLAGCKFALYPLGREDYMEKIYEQIDWSKETEVNVSHSHYATRLDGKVNDIFNLLQNVFDQTKQDVSHVTMTFTLSANSPTGKAKEVKVS
ncbi:YkoF family thiamine/hydroxymethylpyrimidine-binding protein [Cytobacillus sp. OWB-43]|uniref:YkoF family thiamine/hydroxymethylpyrimidine-binding protein n=1 Tax=Cytobacillus sp. OWB-43 TaxID=3108468 RepID=UPI002B002A72|nr:YkoF family thiamine/hydroxymethylpyrimidine-binding protein [Cytobacillus sp. OWB-43]MEA1852323.1 YkoF family thiamine/hydroxymethylpyrimidine-binding protein [Cytobacillus sp. OWB-43]